MRHKSFVYLKCRGDKNRPKQIRVAFEPDDLADKTHWLKYLADVCDGIGPTSTPALDDACRDEEKW